MFFFHFYVQNISNNPTETNINLKFMEIYEAFKGLVILKLEAQFCVGSKLTGQAQGNESTVPVYV
jgi:hypothetical protein